MPRSLTLCEAAVEEGYNYYRYRELWDSAWGRPAEDLFQLVKVPRDAPRTDVAVPDLCPTMRSPVLPLGDQKDTMLIRREYVEALYAVVAYADGRNDSTPTGDAADDGGVEVPQWARDLVSGALNPFFGHAALARHMAFVVTGHPGIGKSNWIIFLLVLRLQARQTTVLHGDPQRYIYVFNAEGVFKVDLQALDCPLSHYVPDGSWCLVDLCEPRGVPSLLLDGGKYLIVQTPSPSAPQTAWIKEYGGFISMFIMKCWTLPELVAGRACLYHDDSPSEVQLRAFCADYNRSARFAFRCATGCNHKMYLDTGLRELSSVENLKTAVNQARTMCFPRHVDTYEVLLIEPGACRCDIVVSIPTRCLFDRLREYLGDWGEAEAARVFESIMSQA